MFNYNRSITLDYTKCGSSDSSAFPVLVSLTDNTLKTVGNGGHVQNANGYDIYFYSDSSLTTRLPAEREKYDASAGTYVGWVKTNVSYTADTVIYIAYGDSGISSDPNLDGTYGATNVWDSNFKGVWHLPNGTTLNVNDSTSNGNNGTNTGVTAGTGKIDGAGVLDGDDYVTISSLNYAMTNLTYSVWVREPAVTGNQFGIVSREDGNQNQPSILAQGNNVSTLYAVYSSGYFAPFNVPLDGSWHLLISTYANGNTVTSYLDGQLQSSVSRSYSTTTTNPYVFGRFYYNAANFYFKGYIDEVQISSIVRSADWILTEYNNQNDPGNIGDPGFYTVGSENSGAAANTNQGFFALANC